MGFKNVHVTELRTEYSLQTSSDTNGKYAGYYYTESSVFTKP